MKTTTKSIWLGILSVLILACSKQETALKIPVGSTIEIIESDTEESIIEKAAHIVPNANQHEALKNEFIAFIHFGPNTFTRMEWGNGKEDPAIFNLKELDTDQWCKAIKDAGMKMVVFTAKHHDGFVLWQSRYTKHGVMSSPYKDGNGDVLKELSESCKKYGLKLGVYLSPADLFQIENEEGLYGNLSSYSDRVIPRPVEGRPFENKTTFTFNVDDYNEYFLNQLFELLTEYGPIHEVWFDGAHPKRKGGQKYNYKAWKELIQTLAPEAVVFGKQDLRWCGNESGKTRDTEWNVIPYSDDPNKMNSFADLMVDSIGHKEQLLKGKYLHYQPAETNTSIREGWFYRDEVQGVRNADDVFDIYERSVGGNSIFLLNIPPNRKGRFSDRDVAVLEETGRRIQATYGKDLLENSSGPDAVLDKDLSTYTIVNGGKGEIIIDLKAPVTANRFVVMEAIDSHGERVVKHALDAWIGGEWKEIAQGTNVGYKRILRFNSVETNKFRLRILDSRLDPAIASISAHYYEPRPPLLEMTRDKEGLVTIRSKKSSFKWKPHGEDATKNLMGEVTIRYTDDGSEPTADSKLYTTPIPAENKVIRAVATQGTKMGSQAAMKFGYVKQNWTLKKASSATSKHPGEHAFDGDPATYWSSNSSDVIDHFIQIDLKETKTLSGFGYTPQTRSSLGMIESGEIKVSKNGVIWKTAGQFSFGNLINDPTPRNYEFETPVEARYVKIQALSIAGQGSTASMAEIDLYE